ncbi:MAG: UDP-3-O-[3-hydroxymyristoyl] glucosamine N-acyltransferase [Lentisphaeria bacterium]|jgi:UDP-3-O-[3-hydroxymyristoyl] glucosamine N-acyltransferase
MPVTVTLGELAALLHAQLIGDSLAPVQGIASLADAGQSDITFLSSSSHEQFLSSTKALAVILREESAEKFAGNALIVDDPYLAYATLSSVFDPRKRQRPSVHPTAVIASTAKISASASIGAHCCVGEYVNVGDACEIYPGVVIGDYSTIGEGSLVHANVSIYHNVNIGKHAIIHSATVIGSDGFGFAPDKSNATKYRWKKIHQIGGVLIGDHVEIGSGTTIDRGALRNTVIGDGVIIDNQVHIAHNVEIGENSAIAGCVGIAGSTVIGSSCTFGGGVLVNGHIHIADNSHFNGGTIVTKSNAESGQFASGMPQLDVKKWRKAVVRFSQLDDIVSRLKRLEKNNK